VEPRKEENKNKNKNKNKTIFKYLWRKLCEFVLQRKWLIKILIPT